MPRSVLARVAALAWLAAVAAPFECALADEPAAEAGALALATERVVVFKDGYALFVKRATGTADADGRAWTSAVPDGAVLGCVWAVAGDDGERILAMRSAWHETRTTRRKDTAAVTPLELLRANVGRKVTLGLAGEKATNVAGTILEVLEVPPEAEPAPGPATGPAGESATEPAPRGGTLVALQTDGGRMVLPVADVKTITGGADFLTRTTHVERVVQREKRLSFDLGKEAAGKPASLRLLYFAEGIRWIPTYRVGGALEKDANLALQGEIVNEAEDVAGAAVDLVVGVPSFRFKDVASPLTLETAMHGALHAAAPQLAQQVFANSNRLFGNDEGSVEVREGAGGAPATPSELQGRGEQDLFVIPLGPTTLEKGGRASVPLWRATAPLRHLYTMDVEVVRNERSGEHTYQSAKASLAASPRGASRTPASLVWHELELANEGATPWTTGAALLLKGNLPLGQDVLTYTPPGGKSLLPMTVAVDLRGKYEEREIERRSNALDWSGSRYSLVRKQGAVTVTSYRKEPSTVRVTVSVGGKVESATDGARVVVNDLRAEDWAGGAHAVNNHSDLAWELVLEPGATKTLTYEFGFYVQ